ncbi:MAG: T9SS type A sorting domain-containing protein [Bacteroidia bacterium]|nr:T9SS type A sorting domain-containing protein [Bacteroidia bacterium]
MEITNMCGQVVIQKNIDNSIMNFELIDKGVYLVSVYSDGQKFFKKLLVD